MPCVFTLPYLAVLGLILAGCSESISSFESDSPALVDGGTAVAVQFPGAESEVTEDGVRRFIQLPLHKRLAETTAQVVLNCDSNLLDNDVVGTKGETCVTSYFNGTTWEIGSTHLSYYRFCPPTWNILGHTVEGYIAKGTIIEAIDSRTEWGASTTAAVSLSVPDANQGVDHNAEAKHTFQMSLDTGNTSDYNTSVYIPAEGEGAF